MSASYDLFCRWKHVQKIQSDNAGALALGVSRATVSLWKQGKNAEIHYIERMAVDIGDSPEMWSAVVMAERSNSEDEKAAWRRIAQKLATVAMALCLFVGTALPRDVQAMPQAGNALHDIHYAKLSTWPDPVLRLDPAMAAAFGLALASLLVLLIDGEKLPHLLRKVAPFATKSRHTFGGTSIKAPLIRRNRETVAPDLV